MDGRSTARGILALVPAILLGTACHDSPLGPVEEAPAARFTRGSANAELPFRLSGGARLVAQEFAPGFPGGKSDFGGRCSVPSDFVISFVVDAEAAHLGRITGAFEHCTQIDFQAGASTLADGTANMVTANGDELWATYRTADVPIGDFDEALQFVGGTGRFTNASGDALGNAMCDQASGTCTYEARGVLVYDASDRSRR